MRRRFTTEHAPHVLHDGAHIFVRLGGCRRDVRRQVRVGQAEEWRVFSERLGIVDIEPHSRTRVLLQEPCECLCVDDEPASRIYYDRVGLAGAKAACSFTRWRLVDRL